MIVKATTAIGANNHERQPVKQHAVHGRALDIIDQTGVQIRADLAKSRVIKTSAVFLELDDGLDVQEADNAVSRCHGDIWMLCSQVLA